MKLKTACRKKKDGSEEIGTISQIFWRCIC